MLDNQPYDTPDAYIKFEFLDGSTQPQLVPRPFCFDPAFSPFAPCFDLFDFMTDGMHLSPIGSKIVAKEILKVLKEADWKPSLSWEDMPMECIIIFILTKERTFIRHQECHLQQKDFCFCKVGIMEGMRDFFFQLMPNLDSNGHRISMNSS
ncbi:putative SGNH hydrolase superfamily [Helianthus debilis subsp. tardiflorus]